MENSTNATKLSSAATAAAASRPQRWSVRRKQEIVLRLLRGEPIEAITREIGIEPYRLERWRDRALTGMAAGLKERADDDPAEVTLAAAGATYGVVDRA